MKNGEPLEILRIIAVRDQDDEGDPIYRISGWCLGDRECRFVKNVVGQFQREFPDHRMAKLEAVQALLARGISQKKIARKLGIPYGRLRKMISDCRRV
jgi:hypothetical protein